MKHPAFSLILSLLALFSPCAKGQSFEGRFNRILALDLPTYTAKEKKLDVPPTEMVFELSVSVGGNRGKFLANAAALSPETYQVTSVAGAKEKPVALKGEILGNFNGGITPKIYLRTVEPIKKGTTYRLRLAKELAVRGGGGELFFYKPDADSPLESGGPGTDEEHAFAGLLTYENRLTVGRAEKGTALSLNAAVGKHIMDMKDGRWWGVDLRATGDVGLDTKQRELYSDNWRAEGSVYYHAGLLEKADGNRIPIDFRIIGNVEGDRDFENIDGSVGAAFRASVPFFFNQIYDVLPRLFGAGINGDEEAIASPGLELGYHYTSHLKDDAAAVELGSNRIVGSFEWQLPVFRHLRFPLDLVLPAAGTDFRVNADVLFDLRAIYHIDADTVTDESKITLLLRKDTLRETDKAKKNAKVPSFSLTYARGKSTPKFENYDALIAGFRFPF